MGVKKNCGCGQDPCVTYGAEVSIEIEDGGYQCGKCYTGFEDKSQADNCCSACYECGYSAHVGFERAQKCCACDCDETGGGPNGTCQQMFSAEESKPMTSDCLHCSETIIPNSPYLYCNDCGDQAHYDCGEDYGWRQIDDDIFCEGCYESIMDAAYYRGAPVVIGFDVDKLQAETFEAMGWHDPRWAGDRESVEAKFKAMYPTYNIEEDSIDYLVYSGGNSNKYHVFFLATDPAGNYHSFNAYGRIGYAPTLHHNAGPGTKGSVTQAISKKRHAKSKKGYVQMAEENFGPKRFFYRLKVRHNMEDGWEHVADFDDEEEATSMYYDLSEARQRKLSIVPELKLLEVDDDGNGDVLYIQRNAAEESFAYRVLDYLEPEDYEKIELAKPIRTGWSIGAGITLFSLTVGVFTLAAANLLGRNNGDE
ncbi:MAG: hypothetical protein CMA72_08365 [Euryarchaeota archaeon]|nr:hypothetical protein [Euryarchaeota archaeon]